MDQSFGFLIFIENFLLEVDKIEVLIFLFLYVISTFKLPDSLLEYSGIKIKLDDFKLYLFSLFKAFIPKKKN